MPKWTGHIQMMSNIISNLIVFEIFASEHEYLCFCVYLFLMRLLNGSKLESARRPWTRRPGSTSLVGKIQNIHHLSRPQ